MSRVITYSLVSSRLIQGEMHVKKKVEYNSDHTDSNPLGRHMLDKTIKPIKP